MKNEVLKGSQPLPLSTDNPKINLVSQYAVGFKIYFAEIFWRIWAPNSALIDVKPKYDWPPAVNVGNRFAARRRI